MNKSNSQNFEILKKRDAFGAFKSHKRLNGLVKEYNGFSRKKKKEKRKKRHEKIYNISIKGQL